jgi:diguanylate cyclase (GGDEF)-like protein
VVTAVLTIGVLNLALGFVLAILLEHPIRMLWASVGIAPRQSRRKKQPVESIQHEQNPAPELAPVSPPLAAVSPPPAPVSPPLPAISEPPSEVLVAEPPSETADRDELVWDVLPQSWLERLQSDNLVPRSFAEGALWFIQRTTPECRRDLTSILDRCSSPKGGQLTSDEILRPANAWLDLSSKWVSTIQSNRPEQDADLCDELSHVLDQQLNKIRPAVAKCQQITSNNDNVDSQSLIQPLSELVESTNAVRDQVQEILCCTLDQEKRHADVPEALQLDEETHVINRFGLAKLGVDWVETDPTRVRLVCGVFVDIDHVAAINKQLGQKATDALLASLGVLLKSLIRKERGFDRLARISGQRYLLFFGDTALRNAMYGAERIRGNIQAATFKVAEASIRLTASCAVAEWTERESQHEWLYRMQLLLAEAKNSGRNCTCVGETNGPRVVTPSNANVQAREVVVALK